MNKTLGGKDTGISRVILLFFIYIIVANTLVVKYLYDIKETEGCNNTPMLTLVYDYYLLELGTTITIVLLGILALKNFPLSKYITHTIHPIIAKIRNPLVMISFMINCVFFYVLYEISSKKICNDIHPYLTWYLMYNSSSNILVFIYLLAIKGLGLN